MKANEKVSPLAGETLITLDEAAKDFGGIAIPIVTLKNYVYYGLHGYKLESVRLNRRYTSKEAIQRFIAYQQERDPVSAKPKIKQQTASQVEAGLRKYGIIK